MTLFIYIFFKIQSIAIDSFHIISNLDYFEILFINSVKQYEFNNYYY